jgi:hypothetical protein
MSLYCFAGEIDFDSFSEVLRVAMRQLQTRHKFVDLGHGIGKAILAAVFIADFKEYHGIEILQGCGGDCGILTAWL